MIFFADTDISSVPAEFVKNWWIMVLAFGTLAVQIWLGKNKERKITGTVDTKPALQHVDKAELLALAEAVNAMREENAAMHRSAQTAGENRVMAITQDVNAEMSALAMKIGDITKMITTALVDNAGQGEAINNLKATTHNHQQSISAIHRRIDDIVQQSRSKRNAA